MAPNSNAGKVAKPKTSKIPRLKGNAPTAAAPAPKHSTAVEGRHQAATRSRSAHVAPAASNGAIASKAPSGLGGKSRLEARTLEKAEVVGPRTRARAQAELRAAESRVASSEQPPAPMHQPMQSSTVGARNAWRAPAVAVRAQNPSMDFNNEDFTRDSSALDAILNASSAADLDQRPLQPPFRNEGTTLNPIPQNSLLALLSQSWETYSAPKRDSIYHPAVRVAVPQQQPPSSLLKPARKEAKLNPLLASGGATREPTSSTPAPTLRGTSPARAIPFSSALDPRTKLYDEVYVRHSATNELTLVHSAVKSSNPLHSGLGLLSTGKSMEVQATSRVVGTQSGAGYPSRHPTYSTLHASTTLPPTSTRPTSFLDSPLSHAQSSFSVSSQTLPATAHLNEPSLSLNSLPSFPFGLPIHDTLAHLKALNSSSAQNAPLPRSQQPTGAKRVHAVPPPSPRADLTPFIASLAARRAAAGVGAVGTGRDGALASSIAGQSPARTTLNTPSRVLVSSAQAPYPSSPSPSPARASRTTLLGPPSLVPSPSPAARKRPPPRPQESPLAIASPSTTSSDSSYRGFALPTTGVRGAFAVHRKGGGGEDFTMQHIGSVLGVGVPRQAGGIRTAAPQDAGMEGGSRKDFGITGPTHQKDDVTEREQGREKVAGAPDLVGTVKGKTKKEEDRAVGVAVAALSNAQLVVENNEKTHGPERRRSSRLPTARKSPPAPPAPSLAVSAGAGADENKENVPRVASSERDVTLSKSRKPSVDVAVTARRPSMDKPVGKVGGSVIPKDKDRRKSGRERRTTEHFLPWGDEGDE